MNKNFKRSNPPPSFETPEVKETLQLSPWKLNPIHYLITSGFHSNSHIHGFVEQDWIRSSAGVKYKLCSVLGSSASPSWTLGTKGATLCIFLLGDHQTSQRSPQLLVFWCRAQQCGRRHTANRLNGKKTISDSSSPTHGFFSQAVMPFSDVFRSETDFLSTRLFLEGLGRGKSSKIHLNLDSVLSQSIS